MTPLLQGHPSIKKIIPFDRRSGLLALLRLGWALRQEKYSHVYDAHNNLRSRILCWTLSSVFGGPIFLRRSIRRWKRFLLFNFRINRFQMPFSGQRDLLEPLTQWGLSPELPKVPQFFPSESARSRVNNLIKEKSWHRFVTLAPSSAYELKRWPLRHWQSLIQILDTTKFVCLGGPEDTFLEALAAQYPDRVWNLAGKLNLAESAAMVERSQLLIANDTGVMHLAEQLGNACFALMGPAPFGFPSRPSTVVFERNLSCRPCSKHGQGPCRNSEFQKCLVDITPEEVAVKAKELLKNA